MAHRPVPALVDRQGGLVMNILDFSCLVPPPFCVLKKLAASRARCITHADTTVETERQHIIDQEKQYNSKERTPFWDAPYTAGAFVTV